MRPLIFILLAAGLAFAHQSCKKEEPSKCVSTFAANGLKVRIIDTNGRDILFYQQRTPIISQPCRTTPLVFDLFTYSPNNNSDSAIIIRFSNLRNPEIKEGVTCFRILFDWGSGDEDTVDWHYRSDQKEPGCILQSIDYMSYNGVQASWVADSRNPYYLLVKQP